MKWMIGGVLAAWAGIVWLAWTLADRHIGYYVEHYYLCNAATAIERRDSVLVWGASVPLALFVALALLGVLRLNRRRSASRDLEPRDRR